jgi:hypothetical protein
MSGTLTDKTDDFKGLQKKRGFPPKLHPPVAIRPKMGNSFHEV